MHQCNCMHVHSYKIKHYIITIIINMQQWLYVYNNGTHIDHGKHLKYSFTFSHIINILCSTDLKDFKSIN